MSQSKPTYIVAVSGGVDSVVLLHMLINHGLLLDQIIPDDSQFIVAHINHGIRVETSSRDQFFVEELAKSYGLEYETCNLELGEDASEEQARNERYRFLDEVARKHQASGIILAHHSDDIVETAMINLVRGTGRRGLSSLVSTPSRNRPLLHLTKQQLLDYAQDNSLKWVEDESNQNHKYLRNRLRSKLSLDENQTAKALFTDELQKIKQTNEVLDNEVATILQYKIRGRFILSRNWFVKLPHDVACEVMHASLIKLSIPNVDRKLVETLTIALKVARPGAKFDIDKDTIALITKRSLRFVNRQTLKTHTV